MDLNVIFFTHSLTSSNMVERVKATAIHGEREKEGKKKRDRNSNQLPKKSHFFVLALKQIICDYIVLSYFHSV